MEYEQTDEYEYIEKCQPVRLSCKEIPYPLTPDAV